MNENKSHRLPLDNRRWEVHQEPDLNLIDFHRQMLVHPGGNSIPD